MNMNIINTFLVSKTDPRSDRIEQDEADQSVFQCLYDEKKTDIDFRDKGKTELEEVGEDLHADHNLSLEDPIKKNLLEGDSQADENDDLIAWLMAFGLMSEPLERIKEKSTLDTVGADHPTVMDVSGFKITPKHEPGSFDFNPKMTKENVSAAKEHQTASPIEWLQKVIKPNAVQASAIQNGSLNDLVPLSFVSHPSTAPVPLQAVAIPNMTLNTPITHPQWVENLGQHIAFYLRNDIQKAELRLHPEELGSLHIQLEMQGGKMQIHLDTLHSAVKKILESALPELRTSLADQGIELQNANVNHGMSMSHSPDQAFSRFRQSTAPHMPSEDISEDEFDGVATEKPLAPLANMGVSVFA